MKLIPVLFALAASTAALPGPAAAQEDTPIFGGRSASVTYGPYIRLEFGGAALATDGAYWQPQGDDDPRISFDAEAENGSFSALALGFDRQDGIRGEVALFATGSSDLEAPCSGTSDGSPCSDHASISDASVSTHGIMANVFYAPLEARGSNSIFQPFVVAGVGVARNEVGDWTRENINAGSEFRSFEGDSTTGLAWSAGIGASLQVTKPGKWPVIVEASWRHYDFGSASGSAVPLPGSGSGQPSDPFTFDLSEQVISLGVRIPLKRY